MFAMRTRFVCLTLAKWETVSGQFRGYLREWFPFSNWLLKCQVSLTWAYIAFAVRFLT